eukprot:SAG22_NODE_500_length_9715_cov_29.986793_5_plen_168_part_00
MSFCCASTIFVSKTMPFRAVCSARQQGGAVPPGLRPPALYAEPAELERYAALTKCSSTPTRRSRRACSCRTVLPAACVTSTVERQRATTAAATLARHARCTASTCTRSSRRPQLRRRRRRATVHRRKCFVGARRRHDMETGIPNPAAQRSTLCSPSNKTRPGGRRRP